MHLRSANFLFLDCQTSGLSAARSEILELGWSFSFLPEEIQTQLIRPEKPDEIAKKVWKITGLTPEALESEPSSQTAWKALIEKAQPRQITAAVIHYAQFELPFLKALHQQTFQSELPWPIVCTYRLANRVCAELPARTLRALSGHLGAVLPEVQRSRDHVEATQRIWNFLIERLEKDHSISTWEQFLDWWQNAERPKEKPKRQYQVDLAFRKSLPTGPGIYEMRSGTGTLLYIGKATSLRSRVSSYFQQRKGDRQRLPELMTQVKDIQVIETHTPLEAALLEQDRIKEFDPPYNQALRQYDRKLSFFSMDLQTSEASPKEGFWKGPFISDQSFDSLDRLLRVFRDELDPLDETILMYPAESIRSVFNTFLDSHQVETTRLDSRRLWQLAKRLPPHLEFREEEEEQEETSEEVEATPEEIRASIERKLRRSVRRIHLSSWKLWLMECRVFWWIEKEASWRFLEISNGQIIQRGSLSEIETLGPYRRNRVSMKERIQKMDIVMYDRLRVLATELRVIAKDFPIRIQFSSTRELSKSPDSFLSRTLLREKTHFESEGDAE